MRIPSAGRKRARIEIIPLIDVVFFLLATFVMVSMSMVKNQGILVRLPAAATGTPQERAESVTITVTESGDLFLNQERIGMPELRPRLQSMKARAGGDLRVFIHGDEQASFGGAVRVLDEVRQTGITKIAIQTHGARPQQEPR